MGSGTSISWTDATWNPVRGCSRVSEGCRNCYAERVAARFSDVGMPYHGLARRVLKTEGLSQPRWTGEVRLIPEHLADPLKWKRPRRIFVNSMSDLFHERLTNEEIAAVFGVMAAAPQHTFQVLTKRAKRMREWFERIEQRNRIEGTTEWDSRAADCWEDARDKMAAKRIFVHGSAWDSEFLERAHLVPWPLPNVWLGVSVENQEAADERIPELLRTPAAVRFLSCEPLIGPVVLEGGCSTSSRASDTYYSLCRRFLRDVDPRKHLDWVIVGCESGPRARPCLVEWLRSLRDQCAAARVAFFCKQAVQQIVDGRDVVRDGTGSKCKSGCVIELPYLDGVQHAAFPVQP